MNNTFFEASKAIANEFLQSIVFIDDRAFIADDRNSHEFDALQISKVFAESKKICAVYKPASLKDIDNLALIAKKADITVIDWQININENDDLENSEEDAKEDDPRGPHTLKIINNILSDPLDRKGSLKLILIYTGEIGLYDITDDIFKDLKSNGIEDVQKDDCSIFTDNIKILVVAKPSSDKNKKESKFRHNPELINKIIPYEDLPSFILSEFTEMTRGLLSNFVLQSLSVLRNNTFTLLNKFDKNLDPAFLSHKALLPVPNDASDQILEIIGSEIKSLLISFNATQAISDENIKIYIENKISKKERIFNFPERDKFKSIEIPEKLNRDLLIKFCEVGIEKKLIPKNAPSSESILFAELCHKVLTKYYLYGTINEDNSNKNLALLTSVKSVYSKEFMPILTLGTIVSYSRAYWVCITPKCDCTRIKKNRDFLFALLKLVDPNDKFDFILMNKRRYLHYRINYSIHQTRFFKLKANGDGVIKAVSEKEKIFFKGSESILEWLGELKSDFAQSIANGFSTQLARVGMDHSEWLRRS